MLFPFLVLALFLLASPAGAQDRAPLPPIRPDFGADRFSGQQPIEPRRWPKIAPTSPPWAAPPEPADCAGELAALGIKAGPADVSVAKEAACAVDEPVALQAVTAGGRTIEIAGAPVLACAMAKSVSRFV